MSDIKFLFIDIDIQIVDEGFYEGYLLLVMLVVKIGFVVLMVWVLLMFGVVEYVLVWLNIEILLVFNFFYIVVVGVFVWFFLVVVFVLVLGQFCFGKLDERFEFSMFLWFVMMFGVGLGVGLMVYFIVELLSLWQINLQIIQGQVVLLSVEVLILVFCYIFLYYGLYVWLIYVVIGLCLVYYVYICDMLLMICMVLMLIFGCYMNGVFGNVVDVLGVVVMIFGIVVIIGFGISQLVEGVYFILGVGWLLQVGQNGVLFMLFMVGLIVVLIVVMGMLILLVVFGVGCGVKYLLNFNLVLLMVLLLIFVVFGVFGFVMIIYGQVLVDYVLYFLVLFFEVYLILNELG